MAYTVVALRRASINKHPSEIHNQPSISGVMTVGLRVSRQDASV